MANYRPDHIYFGLFLPSGLKADLKRVAWEQRRSLRAVVTEALEKYLAWDAQVRPQEPEKTS